MSDDKVLFKAGEENRILMTIETRYVGCVMKNKMVLSMLCIYLLTAFAATAYAQTPASLPAPPPTSISADTPEEYNELIKEILLEWGFTPEEIEILDSRAPVVVTLLTDPDMTAEKLQNIKQGFIYSQQEPAIDYAPMECVTLNGQELDFDQPAIILNNQLFIPFRAVFEALGATVEWEQSTYTAVATKDETVVAVSIGDLSITVNGVSIDLDAFPQIRNDRILIHEHDLSKAAGVEITWERENRTATIVALTGETNIANNDPSITASEPESLAGYIVIENNALYIDEVEIIRSTDIERISTLGLDEQRDFSNGYYIHYLNKEIASYELTEDTVYNFVDFHLLYIDDPDGDRCYTTTTLEEFLYHLSSSYIDSPPAQRVPFLIQVKDNKVVSVTEEFLFTI